MKSTEYFCDRERLERIQPPVSEAFRQQSLEMIQRLASAEGKPAGSRKRFATVLLAVLLMLALAGAAFSIARQAGILDFLAPAEGLSRVEAFVQTEFKQDGGIVDGISIRVRDAVCDGRTLFISVEAKTEDPNEALLVTLDEYFLEHPEMLTLWALSDTFPVYHLDADALQQAASKRYINPMNHVEARVSGSGVERFTPVVGVNWFYEGMDTVVSNIMIDVQELRDAEKTLLVSIFAQAVKRVTKEAYEETYATTADDMDQPLYIPLEELPLTTEIQAGEMTIRTAVAETPFVFDGYFFSGFEVSVSPLCTYVTVQKAPVENAGGPKMRDIFMHTLLDAQGKPFEALAIVTGSPYFPRGDGTWDHVPLQTIYRYAGELPDSITLQGESETLVLKLTEKE